MANSEYDNILKSVSFQGTQKTRLSRPRRKVLPDVQKVGSISTFIDRIEELKIAQDPDHMYFFRGHGSFVWTCEPHIFRNPGYIKNEHVIFKEMVLRCPDDFNESVTTFQTLVKMQHYSLPTRLLDITTNALVALYFACLPGDGVNNFGEVVVFRIPKSDIKYYDSDTVSVVSNLAKRPRDFKLPAEHLSDEAFNAEKPIGHLIHEIKKEKPYFESKVIRRDLKRVLCVRPKQDNPRIIRQDGSFFLFGMDEDISESAHLPPAYFNNNPRILISTGGKRKILEQLKGLGISTRTLFPEIESVANYMKVEYLQDEWADM